MKKNKAFRNTFYGGLLLFSSVILLGLLLIMNIYYFINLKVKTLFKEDQKMISTPEIDSSFIETNTQFEVITKPVDKVIDTLKINTKLEIKNTPQQVIKKIKDTTISKDTTNSLSCTH